MPNEKNIRCPKCGAAINVSEVLYSQVEEEIKISYETKAVESEKALREQLEKSLRLKIASETEDQLKEMQKELDEKSGQVKELNKSKAEIERLKREKDELRNKIEFEKESEFSEKLKEERTKAQRESDEANALKIKEKEKTIDDLKNQLDEAKRRAEQGSVQLQGEIQELELESILRESYKFDDIEEIKKGARGADVLQTVKTERGAICGKIYYESKRTKDYQPAWLKKLRDDNLEVKADILVLATEAMPDGQPGFFFQDGVWICSFYEIRGLSLLLRYTLLQVQAISTTQQGRETKMEMLYSYLTSTEFRGQFGAIIEGFKVLQDSHQSEKLKTQKIWAAREKQLEMILTNAVNFYGSIKGIAGASIPEIKMLESGSEDITTEAIPALPADKSP